MIREAQASRENLVSTVFKAPTNCGGKNGPHENRAPLWFGVGQRRFFSPRGFWRDKGPRENSLLFSFYVKLRIISLMSALGLADL